MLRHLEAVLFCLVVAVRASFRNNVIDLGYAQYQGMFNSTSNITSFLGIRYAAPPIGALRWQSPRVPARKTGIQQASTQPNMCFQAGLGLAPNSTSLSKRAAVETEDCLFLNVFVSGEISPKSSLPVIVWFHGGGYAAGSAAGDGGDFIRDADGGVISVIVQYRLGLFGFLSGEHVKANGALNAGLLDQRFALKWVQDHIANFGGDPSKVTIWGVSAGGGSVLQHVVANRGNTKPPLFRAAMTSSVFLPSQYNYNDRILERRYADVVGMTGCTSSKDTLSCLRSTDVNKLQEANVQISTNAFFGTFGFVPVVDDTYIVERPVKTLLRGEVNGNVLLAMTNAFDGRIFVNPATMSDIITYVTNLFPNFNAEQVRATAAQYTGVPGLTNPLDQAIALIEESTFFCPSYFLMNSFGRRGFKGEFAVPPANHGDDIGQYFPTSNPPVTSNIPLIKSFSQSFLAVVKSLDPNAKFDLGDITPPWPAWSVSTKEMLFNTTETGFAVVNPIVTDPGLLARCRFWQNLSPITPQ